jgi:hypothetical protein
MSAVVINFRTGNSYVPPVPKTERLAAIEQHRAKMAAHRDSSPLAKLDPIFAAIDAHCIACASYHAASDDDAASDVAMKVEGDVLRTLLRSRAVSMTGLVALLEHLGQPEFLIFGDEGTDETVLSGAMEYIDEAKTVPLTLSTMLRNAFGMVPRDA